jgi:hypothetical protein
MVLLPPPPPAGPEANARLLARLCDGLLDTPLIRTEITK